MTIKRLGIIGSGAIAAKLIEVLAGAGRAPLDVLACLTSQRSEDSARDWIPALSGTLARNVAVFSDLAGFLAARPQVVVECAGHESVRAYAEPLLASGAHVLVVSTGALTDEALHQRLIAASKASGAKLILSAGALTSLDFLGTARLAGASRVDYTSRKPPLAWRGTDAETMIDLDSVKTPAVFFEGDACKAAAQFPKNANVAATIALAGVGFADTHVRLMADPTCTSNIHEITVKSAAAETTFRIVGKPAPDNPKTSLSTAYSLAREVLGMMDSGNSTLGKTAP